MFHSNIQVPVPLENLKQGDQNGFGLTVAEEQSWDWPQNLVYGVVLRIFYGEKEHPIAKISGIASGDVLENKVQLSLDSTSSKRITKVDFIGLYGDVNPQGDGKYRQWQYRYHRGKRQDLIGSATTAPFEVTWDTAWLPDQDHPIKITALATDTEGFTHVLPVIENLRLPPDHNVILLKPYGQDPFWTTRNGEHAQYFHIPFEPSQEDQARLYWSSWSPCYSEGISINGTEQENNPDTPCYDAYWHEVDVADASALQKGKNELKTLKTPLHDGEMVHGMDVQWPGIMMKVKRAASEEKNIDITTGTYENRDHFMVHTETATYYYDIAGGGFSRIIDRYGNDWVSYKTEPWNQYPASAASAYRGLPNLVFKSDVDGGAGHPGHDKVTSEVVSENKIRTNTKSGAWEWEWTFNDDHAVLEVLKTDGESPYWFLYEGTPGGDYSPEKYSFGTSEGGPNNDIPDFYKGDISFGNFDWAYFNKNSTDATFYVAQVTGDQEIDMMSYLGNSDQGAESEDGMTVFGFGRGKDTEPLLTGKNTFVIGITDFAVTSEEGHQKIAGIIDEKIDRHL
jgi:hypothetical protein